MSHTFWWGITALGESILGAVVETGTGRLDLGDEKGKKMSNLDFYFSALISSKSTASSGVKDKHSLDFSSDHHAFSTSSYTKVLNMRKSLI